MRILCLDQSTKTGWAFGVEGDSTPWHFGSFRMPKRDEDGERFVIFRDSLLDLIERYRPDILGAEETYLPLNEAVAQAEKRAKNPDEDSDALRFNVAMIKFLNRQAGVMMEVAARNSMPVKLFTSATWRKTALGFGKMKGWKRDDYKRQMIKVARDRGYAVKDDNEADAIGIMLHMMNGRPSIERAQDSLFEKFGADL